MPTFDIFSVYINNNFNFLLKVDLKVLKIFFAMAVVFLFWILSINKTQNGW